MNIGIEESLTPSFHGENCRNNGENPEIEPACDNCDYFLICFPDAEEFFCNPEDYEDAHNYRWETASEKVVRNYLKCSKM